jgi:cytochrome c556
VSLTGCASAEEKPAEEATPAPAAPVPFVSVPELKELMAGKIEVDSNLVLNAPYDENALKNDADWKKVEEAAGRLVDAGKSLLDPPLAKDQGKWKEEAQKMMDLAEGTRKAAQAKDKKALEDAGGKLLEESCTSCHKVYFNP